MLRPRGSDHGRPTPLLPAVVVLRVRLSHATVATTYFSTSGVTRAIHQRADTAQNSRAGSCTIAPMPSSTSRPPANPARGHSGHPRGKYRLEVVLGAVIVGVGAWLAVPGLGPDVLGLENNSVHATGRNTELINQLDALEVQDVSDPPLYDRAQFGDGWADLDGDNCNTRNEILARDLSRPTFRPNTNECVVQTGTLAEPYTGTTVEFVRGQGTSELVQIDHVVALADAWRSGAWQWDAWRRLEFANDPLNLLAVDGQENYDKESSSADQWLPSNEDFHCQYVARQVAVKSKWNLAVTTDEARTMRQVLESCPETTVDQ